MVELYFLANIGKFKGRIQLYINHSLVVQDQY